MKPKIDRPERIVADLMSTEVLTLERNDVLTIADQLMKQKRVRHLAVLDEDGVLCGIVSQRDLFRGAILRSLGYEGGHAVATLCGRVPPLSEAALGTLKGGGV